MRMLANRILSAWLPSALAFGACATLALARPQQHDTPDEVYQSEVQQNEGSDPALGLSGSGEDETSVDSGALGGGRAGPNYLIGPEDVLVIDVFNLPELTKTVRVANDGTISLPLLGAVHVSGLTPTELRLKLESRYQESYLENPQVSVFVKEFHAQPVSVIGAVEKPGLYQLTGPRTLIEMLSMAGGLAKRTSAPAGRTVLVTRKRGFGALPPVEGMQLIAPGKLEINLQRLLYSRDQALNIEIQPLDIVSVSKADIVYVVGAVKKPTGIVLEDQEKITVLQALAMAEGLTGTASRGSARIIRRLEEGERIEVRVNIGKILKGKSPDPELAANDVLFVPDSTGKVVGKRGIEAAVGTVSGILIWRR